MPLWGRTFVINLLCHGFYQQYSKEQFVWQVVLYHLRTKTGHTVTLLSALPALVCMVYFIGFSRGGKHIVCDPLSVCGWQFKEFGRSHSDGNVNKFSITKQYRWFVMPFQIPSRPSFSRVSVSGCITTRSNIQGALFCMLVFFNDT